MKQKHLTSTLRILSFLTLFSTAAALAQQCSVENFVGLLNGYSPAAVKGGPWEMHGEWTLNLHRLCGSTEPMTGDFAADMTMSDYATTASGVDPTMAGQNPHTHRIKLTNATVTWNTADCPTYSPATTTGFQINGTVSLMTGNGSIAPFETDPPSSTLQVCVTGGNAAPYSIESSNVSLVFGGNATKHFGTQAINGVVHTASTGSTPMN